MTIAAVVSRWDPERHAHRLAPAGALLAVTGGCFGGVAGFLLVAVGVALLLASCYSRQDGLLLLGPLTYAELTRAARRRRVWVFRTGYALAAGAVILGNIEKFAPGSLAWTPRYYPPSQITYINNAVTMWFGIVLSLYAIVLTLQLMPSIVAEEREAKRWDLLLTTDLRPREILLGKATARLLLVFEPILAVLPVLAIMPLLGGLDPATVALFGLALLAIVASTSAVAVFNSLFAETSKDAQGRTVGWLFGYYGLTGALLALAWGSPLVGGFPTTSGLTSPVDVQDVAAWLAVGNPILLLSTKAYTAGTFAPSFWDSLVAGLPPFLAFHAGVVLLYGLMACRRLRFAVPWRKQSRKDARRVRRAEASTGPTPQAPVFAATATVRPPMGDEPLAWWTRYGHRRGRLALDIANPRKFSAYAFGTLIVLLAAVYPLDYVWQFVPWGRRVAWLDAIRAIIPVGAWLLTMPLFLRPLFHGAASIAAERQADTMTGVLLMPLTSREIVIEKWRGTIQESLSVYYFLLAFGLAAILTGFLHPLSLPVLAVVVWPGTMLAAAIGVYFSTTATTVARAKRWTALAVFGGGYVGPMALGWALSKLITDARGRFSDWQAALLALPLPPATTFFPAMIGTLTLEKVRPNTAAYVLGAGCVLVGCIVQSAAAYAVVGAAARRFERSRGQ
jgi:ABC-type Na+ efflux pump permease subunit